MFLFLLCVLQLSAATNVRDEAQEEGTFVVVRTDLRWVETRGEMRMFDVSGCPINMSESTEAAGYCYPEKEALIRKEFGKTSKEMDICDWLKFYTMHPEFDKGVEGATHHQGTQDKMLFIPRTQETVRGTPRMQETVRGTPRMQETEQNPLGLREFAHKEYGKTPSEMTSENWLELFKLHPEIAPPSSLMPSTQKVDGGMVGRAATRLFRRRFFDYVGSSYERSLTYVRARKAFYTNNEVWLALSKDKERACEGSPLSGAQKATFDTQIMQARIEQDRCIQAVKQAERDILMKVLCQDKDYFPGKAMEVAQAFVQNLPPDFSLGTAECFGPFLQGLWSKLSPANRWLACHLGAEGSRGVWGGLEQYLLELKYSTPVVAVAIAQAIVHKESQGKESFLSQEELVRAYELVSQGAFLAKDAAAFALGQSYAEQVKSLVMQAGPACWVDLSERTESVKQPRLRFRSVDAAAPQTQLNLSARFCNYHAEHVTSELACKYSTACNKLREKKRNVAFLKGLSGGMVSLDVERAEGELQQCVAALNDAEAEILREILRDDADYCPAKATEEANEFLQAWHEPYFCCTEGNFGSFLQGLFSELDFDSRQKVWDFGASTTYNNGLEKHLLELKYNAPVVAVAIVQAILRTEDRGPGSVVSQEQLHKIYNNLQQGLISPQPEGWDSLLGARCAERARALGRDFLLGERYAERARAFLAKADADC